MTVIGGLLVGVALLTAPRASLAAMQAAVRLGVDLVRHYRTVPRVALRLVLNLAWLAVFVLAYRSGGLVEIAEIIRSSDLERALRLAQTSMSVTLIVLAGVSAILAATDVVRLVRR